MMDSLDKFRSDSVLADVAVPEVPELPLKSKQTEENFELLSSALEGHNGLDQLRIAEKGLAWVALMLRKNTDYGSSALKTPCLAPNLPAKSAILVRMSDKIERLQHLLKGNTPLVAEKFEETLQDLSVYGLLYLVAKE